MKSLTYAMRKLVRFLTRNPNEIVTVFLEDYISDTKALMSALNQTTNLTQLLFNPHAPEWNVLEKGWPKISDMIKANKRLLIVDEEKRTANANKLNGLIRTRDFLIQNHFQWIVDLNDNNSNLIVTNKLKLADLDSLNNSANASRNTFIIKVCQMISFVFQIKVEGFSVFFPSDA